MTEEKPNWFAMPMDEAVKKAGLDSKIEADIEALCQKSQNFDVAAFKLGLEKLAFKRALKELENKTNVAHPKRIITDAEAFKQVLKELENNKISGVHSKRKFTDVAPKSGTIPKKGSGFSQERK